MPNYNDTCSSGGQTYLNTGANDQCLEAVTVLLFLSRPNFRFADVDAFKSKEAWDAAIENRDIVPLFELYELAPANTDETFYESRNFKKRTQRAAKITTAELYLSICSDNALRSYANSEYTRVFEATEDGDVIGVFDEDRVKIKGQHLKDFTVGIRQAATTEKPPTTAISITYSDYEELASNGVITTPEFDPVLDLSGIFNISFKQTGVGSETEITFKATIGCSNTNYPSLDTASLKLFEADGITDQTGSFAYDAATETYTITGVDMVSGIVSTDGVQVEVASEEFYEGTGNVTAPVPG